MTSARRLYRLQLALSALGAGVGLLALAVAVRPLDFSLPDAGTLVEACGNLLPHAGGPGLLALPLAALGLAVLVLAIRSSLRQLRASRRFVGALRIVRHELREGVPVSLFESDRPQAFCAGLLRPRIYASTAASALPAEDLRAVLAHERHHVARRDPLRILLARTLGEALFFAPVLSRLAERYAALAEVAADEAALREHDASTLAAALLSFGESPNPATVVGVSAERVDCLLGERPHWELPVSLALGSAVALGGLVATALAVGSLTSAAELNVAMLLAQSCMLVMLAAPVLVVAGALILGRGPRPWRGRR